MRSKARALATVLVVLLVPLMMGAAGYYGVNSHLRDLVLYFDPTTVAAGDILAYSDNTDTNGTNSKKRVYEVVNFPKVTIPVQIGDDHDGIYYSSPAAAAALWVGSTGTVTTTAMAFDKDTDEALPFTVKLPEKLASSGNIAVKVGWLESTDEASKAVIWGVEAIAVGDGDSFGTTTSVTASDDTANSSMTFHQVTVNQSISTLGASGGDLLYLRLYRDADPTNDSYGYDANLISLDVDCPINPL